MATSAKLGKMASLLLQEERVRLYQTAVFHKGKGALNMDTAWHQDLAMVPLDTNNGGYVTIWCPLRSLHGNARDSLLWFADGSHRDMSLTKW